VEHCGDQRVHLRARARTRRILDARLTDRAVDREHCAGGVHDRPARAETFISLARRMWIYSFAGDKEAIEGRLEDEAQMSADERLVGSPATFAGFYNQG
jgi:hypothetical protein